MSDKRAVIWDLDGTIIDSGSHHWEAWKVLMAVEKFSITYDDYVSDFGRRNDEILRSRVDPNLDEIEIGRLSRSKEEAYRHLVRTRGVGLFPGVEQWLTNLLEDGWLQALGTSAPYANIEVVFEAHPVRRYFDAVMSADQVAHGKPYPDVFLAAAREAGVSPARCVVIEDAPAGIEAARRAGMRSLAVQTTHPRLEGDWTVATLDLLPRDFFHHLFNN